MSKDRLRYRRPEQWLADADAIRPLVEGRRLERMEQVLGYRTRHLTLVAEDTHDPHNAAALVRTSDALGLTEVHAVTRGRAEGYFQPSRRIDTGASRWLDLHAWHSTSECLEHLKRCGYRIAVTTIDARASVMDLDWTPPTAIVVGNERDGASADALERADVCVSIPMLGFVESLNLSVATAICLFQARAAMAAARGSWAGDLDEEERAILRAKWTLESVPRAEAILEALRHRDESAST